MNQKQNKQQPFQSQLNQKQADTGAPSGMQD